MKKIFALGLCLFLVVGLFSVSAGGGKEDTATAGKKVVKVGHPNAGQEYDQYQYLLVAMDRKLGELSKGTLGLDIYSDSVLGSERDMFDSVKMGVQDMILGSTVPISSSVPQLQIFDMPYLFDNTEEFRKLISDDKGTLDEVRTALLNNYNMKNLIFAEGGFRRLMGKGEPMTSVDKIKGK